MPEDLKEKKEFTDLIYANCLDQVKAAFPTFTVEDASDEIHEERASVTGPEDKFDEYLLWLIRNNLARASFWVGLTLRCAGIDPAKGKKDDLERLKRLFYQVQAEKESGSNPGAPKGS